MESYIFNEGEQIVGDSKCSKPENREYGLLNVKITFCGMLYCDDMKENREEHWHETSRRE